MGSVLVIQMFAKQPNAIGSKRHRRSKRSERGGIALLICLFVLSLVTVWTVDMLESASIYQSALRNTIEYEQSLYQANAGVQHVLSQLETDVSWRGTATAGSYPASGSYSATAVNGAIVGTVDVTSTGVAGATTRRVQATILVN
jgi:Tfp pilus assembly protein PilX